LFQDIDGLPADFRIAGYYGSEPVIQPNDRLFISVSSPVLNQEKVAQFNLPLTSFLAMGEVNVSETPTLTTYLVEKDSCINFPVVGKIKLAGLSKSEAIKKIEDLVLLHAPDLVSPTVNMQLLGFNVYVIGEVNSPGRYGVTNEKLSLTEAIAIAGGMTIYGNRETVLLVRNNGDRLEHVRFDLTKSDVFSSPYYYLQQNDMIIIESNNKRLKDSNVGQADNYRMQIISLAFSVFSLIASTAVTVFTITKVAD
jgi:polysaccharide export outer membrane protein